MNLGTCIVHSSPCSGQTPLSAMSSHRSGTEIAYHVRPVGGLLEDLLQVLNQHAIKNKIINENFPTKFSFHFTKYKLVLKNMWWSPSYDSTPCSEGPRFETQSDIGAETEALLSVTVVQSSY